MYSINIIRLNKFTNVFEETEMFKQMTKIELTEELKNRLVDTKTIDKVLQLEKYNSIQFSVGLMNEGNSIWYIYIWKF